MSGWDGATRIQVARRAAPRMQRAGQYHTQHPSAGPTHQRHGMACICIADASPPSHPRNARTIHNAPNKRHRLPDRHTPTPTHAHTRTRKPVLRSRYTGHSGLSFVLVTHACRHAWDGAPWAIMSCSRLGNSYLQKKKNIPGDQPFCKAWLYDMVVCRTTAQIRINPVVRIPS